MAAASHQLTELRVGDEADAWRRAGFAVTDGGITIGATRVVPVGEGAGRGIHSVAIDGLSDLDLDGITVTAAAGSPSRGIAEHPNGVTGVDHLVVLSPDVDRTTARLGESGIEARRVRRFEVDGRTRRQTFFWLGDVILELVGDDAAHGDGPAQPWGLALTCADLDASVAMLGEACGPAKDAVQPGRRIATVRTRELGVSVPVALMSPHRG